VGAPQQPPAAAVSPPIEEYAAEFAGSTGLAPLADPPVGGLASTIRPALFAAGPATTSAPAGQGRGWAQAPVVARPSDTGDDPQAVRLLHRAVEAAHTLAYAGVRNVVSTDAGPATSLALFVRHVPGQGTSFALAESDAPASAATFVAQREAANTGLEEDSLRLLVGSYDIGRSGADLVAGRRATIVTASRGGVLSARFWIDEATGLLLRREVYDRGRLVRSSGFEHVTTSRPGFLPHLPPVLDAPPSTKLPLRELPVLNDDGWVCPRHLGVDFTLLSLQRLDPAGTVMHAAYTDGLSSVSVFEQRGTLDRSALAGFEPRHLGHGLVLVRAGLPTVSVWGSGGTVFTVVTDAPQSTFARLVADLPHARPRTPDGFGRVSTGLSRIGSFVRGLV
jgi:hypothetical protein